jgi:hypothetical protein
VDSFVDILDSSKVIPALLNGSEIEVIVTALRAGWRTFVHLGATTQNPELHSSCFQHYVRLQSTNSC